MKKITVSLVTIMTSLALTSPLYAAGESKDPAQTSQSREMKAGSSQLQSARDILGMSVVAENGEALGKIQDIKLDTSSGRINFVTIQKGGVMGIGGQEGIAVPLEAFQFSDENAKLTVDKTKLDTAPKQSGMSDQEFQRGLESHYGVSPAWQEGGGKSSQRMHMDQPGQQKMPMDPGKSQDPSKTQQNPL